MEYTLLLPRWGERGAESIPHPFIVRHHHPVAKRLSRDSCASLPLEKLLLPKTRIFKKGHLPILSWTHTSFYNWFFFSSVQRIGSALCKLTSKLTHIRCILDLECVHSWNGSVLVTFCSGSELTFDITQIHILRFTAPILKSTEMGVCGVGFHLLASKVYKPLSPK